jgi:hypothetical protein
VAFANFSMSLNATENRLETGFRTPSQSVRRGAADGAPDAIPVYKPAG